MREQTYMRRAQDGAVYAAHLTGHLCKADGACQCRRWMDKARVLVTSCGIRAGLVASTVAVALAVPHFAYVTALGGALFGLTVCVCIPALAFLKITWGCVAGSMFESS